jgi:hypothetical protein
MIVSEMEVLDQIFATHFGGITKYFMTSTSEWREGWRMYVEALERHAEGLAQRPEENGMHTRMFEKLSSKVRFCTMDHDGLYLAPPFPLMTKSVIPCITNSLKEISGGLYEVSGMYNTESIIPCRSNTFDLRAIIDSILIIPRRSNTFDLRGNIDSILIIPRRSNTFDLRGILIQN